MAEIKVHPFDTNSDEIEALKVKNKINSQLSQNVFYDVKKKQERTKQGEALQKNLNDFMQEFQINQKEKKQILQKKKGSKKTPIIFFEQIKDSK